MPAPVLVLVPVSALVQTPVPVARRAPPTQRRVSQRSSAGSTRPASSTRAWITRPLALLRTRITL